MNVLMARLAGLHLKPFCTNTLVSSHRWGNIPVTVKTSQMFDLVLLYCDQELHLRLCLMQLQSYTEMFCRAFHIPPELVWVDGWIDKGDLAETVL